jgi:hypothetical protein
VILNDLQMKKFILITMFVAAVAGLWVQSCATAEKLAGSSGQVNPIMGTWQLAMYKYGSSASSFIKVPAEAGRIKMITDSHFIWVQYNKATGKITGSAGGTYTLTGNSYTESLDFGLGMDTYIGKDPVYTVKVEGDNLFLSGNLTEGYKIEEVWERVK